MNSQPTPTVARRCCAAQIPIAPPLRRALSVFSVASCSISFCLLFLLSTTTALASDWPNYRGPNHNGVSTETGWTAQWPADGPPVLWKTSVGTGFASVSVSGKRAFTMGNTADTDTVYCLDTDTGKTLWKYSYPCPLSPSMYEGGPSATPTVDGDRVYTLSKTGDLFCLTLDSGKVLWKKSLQSDAGVSPPIWGFSCSPLVDNDLLILDAGDLGLALKKDSGQIAWNSKGGGGSYSSAVPCAVAGAPAVVMVTASGLAAVNAADGKPIWLFPWKTSYDINAADAIVLDGARAFISSGYAHGDALVHLDTGAVIWEKKSLSNHINASVALDGYVYGPDGNMGSAKFTCVDLATGDPKWKYADANAGALIIVDTKIIALSDKGELLIANATPSGFTPLTRAQVLGGKCWTAPTLANGHLYVRNAKGDLACLNVKK